MGRRNQVMMAEHSGMGVGSSKEALAICLPLPPCEDRVRPYPVDWFYGRSGSSIDTA